MDESEDDEVDEEGERIAIMNEAHCRGAHLVSLYVATFLRTVKREWGNVDKHRVDKFYTAVRLMIREVSESCVVDIFCVAYLSSRWFAHSILIGYAILYLVLQIHGG